MDGFGISGSVLAETCRVSRIFDVYVGLSFGGVGYRMHSLLLHLGLFSFSFEDEWNLVGWAS